MKKILFLLIIIVSVLIFPVSVNKVRAVCSEGMSMTAGGCGAGCGNYDAGTYCSGNTYIVYRQRCVGEKWCPNADYTTGNYLCVPGNPLKCETLSLPEEFCAGTGWCYVGCCTICHPGDCGTTGTPLPPGGTPVPSWGPTSMPVTPGPTPTGSPQASCTVTLPAGITLFAGYSTDITASVTNIVGGTVQQVKFLSLNTSIMSVSPSSDSSSPYLTQATGVALGSTTLQATGMMGGVEVCYGSTTVTVSNSPGWWQVRDGDVQTNGELNSTVPSGLYFNIPGLGGFPGVAKYGTGTSLSRENVSQPPFGWLANSLYAPANGTQSYASFRRMVPEEVTLNAITTLVSIPVPSGGTPSSGYEWYEYDASASGNGGQPLSITSSALGSRKVIIFVTGADLNILGRITYSAGQGILIILTNHNINIDGGVGNAASPNFDLMGLFLADGNINTGESSNSLRVKGSVAALGVLRLQRDLGSANEDTPGVYFEYDPASAFLFPPALSIEKTRWKEVAP
jgi:hypothetical protein